MTQPTIRGINHIGVTVSDIESATRFFIEAFGAEAIYQSLARTDPPEEGEALETNTGVAPGTVMRSQRMIKLGDGPNIELFEMHAPEQLDPVRPSDLGMNHLALYTHDPDTAITRFERAGGIMLSGPNPMLFTTEAGENNTFCYGHTPWGMSIEFISYPGTMGYESETSLRRWQSGH